MTQDIALLVGRAMEDPRLNGMQLVVQKELLHYDILFAMEQGGFLEGLVFQGGTALRLCHGAPRFSEDLDFSGGVHFTGSRLAALGGHLTDYLSRRYGLDTVVNAPIEELQEGLDTSLKQPVNRRWRIVVIARAGHRDIPRQRIHLEICNVPSYSHAFLTMKRNYDFLPDGYEDTILRVETKEEILADKLVAFPATLGLYTRWRDLWDIRWLGQQGVTANADMVEAKIADYRIDNFNALLDMAVSRIDQLVDSDDFVAQMKRFLSVSVADRTVQRQPWRTAVAGELKDMLSDLQQQLYQPGNRRPVDCKHKGAASTAEDYAVEDMRKAESNSTNPFSIPDPLGSPKPPWEHQQ